MRVVSCSKRIVIYHAHEPMKNNTADDGTEPRLRAVLFIRRIWPPTTRLTARIAVAAAYRGSLWLRFPGLRRPLHIDTRDWHRAVGLRAGLQLGLAADGPRERRPALACASASSAPRVRPAAGCLPTSRGRLRALQPIRKAACTDGVVGGIPGS